MSQTNCPDLTFKKPRMYYLKTLKECLDISFKKFYRANGKRYIVSEFNLASPSSLLFKLLFKRNLNEKCNLNVLEAMECLYVRLFAMECSLECSLEFFLDNAAGKHYSEESVRLLECSLEFFLDNAAGKLYSEEPVRLSDQQRGGLPPVLRSMELKMLQPKHNQWHH